MPSVAQAADKEALVVEEVVVTARKREENLRQRIFQKGVPRDYEELRKTYVSNNRLTGRAPWKQLGSFADALRANTPRELPNDERLWYFFELFPCHFRCYRRSGKVLGNWGQFAPHSNAVLIAVAITAIKVIAASNRRMALNMC